MIPSVVLASKSAVRAALLGAAGVAFEVVGANVDEDAVKSRRLADGASPRDIAVVLAAAKALAVVRSDALVIGADQTLDLDGRSIDKAATLDEARIRLRELRGRTHRLHAAVAVARAGVVIWSEVVTAELAMRAFSDVFLDDYLSRNADRLLFSVGCYELEGEGVQLFEHIVGDYFAVLGLPMLGLLGVLREHGVIPS